MAYTDAATILGLNTWLPQSTTAVGYTNTLALIGNHLTRAEGIVNSYIADRYDITSFYTTTGGPVQLKAISEDLTAYFTMRTLYSGENQNYNEWVDKYNEMMAQLEMIREGKLALTDDTGTPFSERTSERVTLIESTTEDYAPYFDEDDSLDWRVDPDKLDDISDNRG